MPAIEPLCQLFEIDVLKLSRKEKLILEAEIFVTLYRELNEIFRSYYKNYFHLMKFDKKMEETMLDAEFIKNIINDILHTEEYSLEGIAYYTHIPGEVIQEMASGNNTNPSLHFSRKIIELHRSTKPDLYHEIVKKIIVQHLRTMKL